ncbi:hypothetical protein A6U97_28010 [Agrobacterium tumefaciens]|uniref:PilZ domain-containing protein n=1 Tax=Agrobacterium tumefaciens TaxID=358 RepID=UPI00080FCC0D|nr:hypothetical protein A6U97_28010 [Agrobacterium tumefaciens]
MSERRKSDRMRSLKGARIIYGNGSLTRDCAVRNLSRSGAKLVMPSTAGIPDSFKLEFEDGARKNCIVRWRKLADIGVEFVGEA